MRFGTTEMRLQWKDESENQKVTQITVKPIIPKEELGLLSTHDPK